MLLPGVDRGDYIGADEIRVYLDTCVRCRPFDAVTNERILKEAKSMNKLMGTVDNNEIEILGSSVLLFEVSMIRDDKRVSVEKLIARVVTEISQVKIAPWIWQRES
ncbi:MAG: hypothetical protein ACXQTY_07175 [Candidatus Methanogasteraceae archaeon]